MTIELEEKDLKITLYMEPEWVKRIAERVAEIIEERNKGPEPWIGTKQAAEHLACSPSRIYDLVMRREIPHQKDGSRLLFRRSEIDEWVKGGAGVRKSF